MVEANIVAAFIAGILSFLSPCVLPIIPGFLAYLSGTSLGDTSKSASLKMFLNSVFFVLGFSSIFALMGVILNSVLKDSSYTIQDILAKIGGIIIILFGLYLLKLIKIPILDRERKLPVQKKFKISYVTSFIFGAAFAVGWSPCIGTILGSILVLAATEPGSSFILLLTYAIGLGIPFLLVGLFSSQAVKLINKSQTFLKYFNIIVGIFLIMLGIMVFTSTLNQIANLELINQLILQ